MAKEPMIGMQMTMLPRQRPILGYTEIWAWAFFTVVFL